MKQDIMTEYTPTMEALRRKHRIPEAEARKDRALAALDGTEAAQREFRAAHEELEQRVFAAADDEEVA